MDHWDDQLNAQDRRHSMPSESFCVRCAVWLCSLAICSGLVVFLAMGFVGANDRSEWNKGLCSIKKGYVEFSCLASSNNGCTAEGWTVRAVQAATTFRITPLAIVLVSEFFEF